MLFFATDWSSIASKTCEQKGVYRVQSREQRTLSRPKFRAPTLSNQPLTCPTAAEQTVRFHLHTEKSGPRITRKLQAQLESKAARRTLFFSLIPTFPLARCCGANYRVLLWWWGKTTQFQFSGLQSIKRYKESFRTLKHTVLYFVCNPLTRNNIQLQHFLHTFWQATSLDNSPSFQEETDIKRQVIGSCYI